MASRPKKPANSGTETAAAQPAAAPSLVKKVGASTRKKVNLALQGGGSHGAFTWGVLDRLLDDPRLEIEGVIGTSAGAMNAAALACGLHANGAQGAKETLEKFWMKISEAGAKGPIQRTWFDKMTGNFRLDNSPSFFVFDLLGRLFSPYQLNPMNKNPLKDVVEEVIDFTNVRTCTEIKLFVCATNVRTGKVRVFTNKEMKTDVVLASACLPFMFQAVEIDGEYYYDGGYMGNPCIYPLIYHCDSQDVIIVQINPLYREEIPTTAREIMDRVNEISFNSSLMREMRAVYFVTMLIESGQLDNEKYRKLHVHLIEREEEMKKMGASSKLIAEPEFLLHLRDIGRQAADEWIAKNYDTIGNDSTIDLKAVYL